MRLREINALAGQKNRSAVHYHFGSREGLVEAILSAHQTAMDQEVGPALDALVASGDPTVRDIVAIWVQALSGQLRERSGRNFLRIVPQVLDMVNPIIRRGATGGPPPSRGERSRSSIGASQTCPHHCGGNDSCPTPSFSRRSSPIAPRSSNPGRSRRSTKHVRGRHALDVISGDGHRAVDLRRHALTTPRHMMRW